MNNKPVNHPNNDTKIKPQTTVKYPELSDSELEVVCGGGTPPSCHSDDPLVCGDTTK